jgi:hypothetical protein
MKKWWMIVVVMLAGAGAASAQSQYQAAFEIGVGYTRPGAGSFDMVSLLLQGDQFYFESGIGFGINDGLGGNNVFSWLIRAAARPVAAGNTLVHVGGEFSLHTNSTSKLDGNTLDYKTLSTVGFLLGASHPLSDHLNFEAHVFPFVLEFGGSETVTSFLKAQIGAHILF